ncbi:MAG: protein serine/threonine phosphatase 2C family protein [Dehalococcoidia bacterium]|nr:protein serine/threonine phosphatase 2C family protein [Dehalococcoidia bacterium]MSQ16348.1 protein serine/threonine phosphatase 2C family protein [Dehalococcoidia bacterium]
MLASTVATLQDNTTHGEDTFLVRDLGNGGFLDAVLDGVTGHGGAEASKSLREALETLATASPEAVSRVLTEMNDEFFQVGGGRMLLSTASVALFVDGQLHVLSAGDSPVFLVRGGAIQQLTGRRGGFLPVGAARAVGSHAKLELIHNTINLEAGDRLLLATDGVSDNMLADELASTVEAAASPAAAAEQVERLIAERLEGGLRPQRLGGRYRHDDRTAIFRFF